MNTEYELIQRQILENEIVKAGQRRDAERFIRARAERESWPEAELIEVLGCFGFLGTGAQRRKK